jgi:hypothetical protein
VLGIRAVLPNGKTRQWAAEVRRTRQEFSFHVDEKPTSVTVVTDRTLIRAKAAP